MRDGTGETPRGRGTQRKVRREGGRWPGPALCLLGAKEAEVGTAGTLPRVVREEAW